MHPILSCNGIDRDRRIGQSGRVRPRQRWRRCRLCIAPATASGQRDECTQRAEHDHESELVHLDLHRGVDPHTLFGDSLASFAAPSPQRKASIDRLLHLARAKPSSPEEVTDKARNPVVHRHLSPSLWHWVLRKEIPDNVGGFAELRLASIAPRLNMAPRRGNALPALHRFAPSSAAHTLSLHSLHHAHRHQNRGLFAAPD